MRIALLGGSGTIGHALTKQLYQVASRIVIFSRGEAKQAEMKQVFPEYPDNVMRYMIGDIRDKQRLTEAFRNIDVVVHAAALKRVEVCEYNPIEAIDTNIQGTINVIRACIASNVKKAVLISTDKAVAPELLYGSTKHCAERVFISANNMGTTWFSVCRYANVTGSTGSVLELWENQKKHHKPLTITDNRMTRMWISPEDAAKFIIDKLPIMQRGEIFIPNIKGKKMIGLANELYPGHLTKEIGMRPNEKLHESLITEAESRDCWLSKDKKFYTIYPHYHDWIGQYSKKGKRMPEGFQLSSNLYV